MKKLITVLFFATLTLNTLCQDRVDRQKLSFTESSKVLSKVTGWAYNTTSGEWIDYENSISADKSYKTELYKDLQGKYMMSRCNSFIDMQTKTLIFNENKYYVLIINEWTGSYYYPALEQDWRIGKITIGYIFTEKEYKKLYNIKGVIELFTQYDVKLEGDYDEIKFLDLIQTELLKVKNKYEDNRVFPVTKSNNGSIRFFTPMYYSNSKYDLKYDLTKSYFETDLDNFSNILIK